MAAQEKGFVNSVRRILLIVTFKLPDLLTFLIDLASPPQTYQQSSADILYHPEVHCRQNQYEYKHYDCRKSIAEREIPDVRLKITLKSMQL